MPNDSVNAYYIYNRGNVTYTGFGHTTPADGKTVNINEAKLLINTIVAAYRSNEPQLRFTDSTGSEEKTMTSFLIPTNDGEIITTKDSAYDPARSMFFIVEGNITEGETMLVRFYLADGEQHLALPVYYRENGVESLCRVFTSATDPTDPTDPTDTAYYITGNKVYYVKLDDLIALLPADTDAWSEGVSLRAAIKSVEGASLTLRKLDLFDLS